MALGLYDNLYIFDQYRPSPEWFSHDPYGIHGIAHVARVLVWAECIGCGLNGDGLGLDLEVVRWAAVLHDVGRHDDGKDAGHGKRSAAWVRAHRDAVALLTEEQIEQVVYCCEWHDQEDRHAPRMTPMLKCLKDADGLDRVRIRDLNPAYLRTETARGLCDMAQKLFDATGHSRELRPWETVRKAAVELGFWR